MDDTRSLPNEQADSCKRFASQENQTLALRELWRKLSAGELTIQSAKHTVGRCFVALRRRPAQRVASDIEWQITERMLCGELVKVLAHDIGVASSTISVYWHSTLAGLCDRGALPNARAFLVMCACSTRTVGLAPARLHGINEHGDMVVSVALGEERLGGAGLSTAEREIARAVVWGKTAAEICAERRTSPRTVANQLNAIYRKLRVSGRRELVIAALVPQLV